MNLLLTNIQFVIQRICESKDAAPDLTRINSQQTSC